MQTPSEQPSPCPFCGEHLRPVMDHKQSEVNSWCHPDGGTCILKGWAIGAARIQEDWERRALCFTVSSGGMPVFNGEGQGSLATVKMLNTIIEWYHGSLNEWKLKS